MNKNKMRCQIINVILDHDLNAGLKLSHDTKHNVATLFMSTNHQDLDLEPCKNTNDKLSIDSGG